MKENFDLPSIRQPVVNHDGTASNVFYKFFLSIAPGTQSAVKWVQQILSSLGSTDGTGDTIINVAKRLQGLASSSVRITGINSINGGGDLTRSRQINLVNDVDRPPEESFYGTDNTGTLGYQTLTPGKNIGLTASPGVMQINADIVSYATAITDLNSPNVVSLDGQGNAYYPDLSNPIDVERIVGVTTSAVSAGEVVKIVTSDSFTEASWGWSPGRIYCSTTGGQLTQTIPASPSAIVEVARSVSPTTIRVGIQPAILI